MTHIYRRRGGAVESVVMATEMRRRLLMTKDGEQLAGGRCLLP